LLSVVDHTHTAFTNHLEDLIRSNAVRVLEDLPVAATWSADCGIVGRLAAHGHSAVAAMVANIRDGAAGGQSGSESVDNTGQLG
jgi:hypothetical protein